MSEHLGSEETYEALTRLVRVLSGDPALLEWFEGLAKMASIARRNEVFRMHQELLGGGQEVSEDVVVPLKLLADDRVFEAAVHAINEA